MKKLFLLPTLFIATLFIACSSVTPKEKQTKPALQQKIQQIIAGQKADIGISIIGPGDTEPVYINEDKLYPMLSTVKFPIALTILHQVEKGTHTMAQQILVRKEDLMAKTWSPFRDKYPAGNISISLEEALNWMIAYSDNNITDILLKLAGGPEQVAQFINDQRFVIKNNEKGMHKDWEAQFVNKITPKATTDLLQRFASGKILNKKYTAWLYRAMVNSQTGVKRIKGKLPPEVVVAQRAGTSFTNEEGITGAINNIGIIALPDQQQIYIAVFIHNTPENFAAGEELIADIARASWEYYSTTNVAH